jgi:predicted amidophosphoribosyltransferase
MEALVCQQCGAVLQRTDQGGAVCPYCQTEFTPTAHICPQCQQEAQEDVEYCAHCGASLKVACPECGFANWNGVKYCVRCGANWEAAWRMIHGFQQAYVRQRASQQERLHSLRQEEEKQSQLRMQQFINVDRQRILGETKEAESAKRRENLLVRLVAIGFIVFFILFILIMAMNIRHG